MANQLSGFLGKESDIGGARFPGYICINNRELCSDSDSDSDYEPIEFDSQKFMEKLAVGLGKDEQNTGDNMEILMAQMDAEIKSVPTKGGNELTMSSDVSNLDANLVSNLLDSFMAQEGLAGPGSNILGSLGYKTKQ